MKTLKDYDTALGIEEKVFNLGNDIESNLKPRFEAIDSIAEFNQIKVLSAMQKAGFSDDKLPEGDISEEDFSKENMDKLAAFLNK